MKKIFVLTGEPSGDKLASTAISKLQNEYNDIEYLSVGGSNLGVNKPIPHIYPNVNPINAINPIYFFILFKNLKKYVTVIKIN